jgi:hypothetical protein
LTSSSSSPSREETTAAPEASQTASPALAPLSTVSSSAGVSSSVATAGSEFLPDPVFHSSRIRCSIRSPSLPSSSGAASTNSSSSSSSSGSATTTTGTNGGWPIDSALSAVRISKFKRCLESPVVDVDGVLREAAWAGIPACYRVSSWQLMLGYLPPHWERSAASLSRKKQEYEHLVAQYFGGRGARSEAEQALLRQVLVDIPRTFSAINLFRSDFVQRSLERVLYVWALRHPASGYVQGLNDLASVFYAVFLSPWAGSWLCIWRTCAC